MVTGTSPATPSQPAAKLPIAQMLAPHTRALLPGLGVVALLILWAAHEGGYNSDTWYWGALVLLGMLGVILITLGSARLLALNRPARIALAAFALYVAWSYVSIAWARSPGDALQGSNRALLYLLLFAVMLLLPWSGAAARVALVAYALGVGVIAFVLLFRLASASHLSTLITGGRLAPPTGYINATAALFTTQVLVATALAARRELPGLLRGLLIAMACAGLQLAITVESRGWLFTLPLVAILAIALVRDRLRVAFAALLPIAAAALPVHRLLALYKSSGGAGLSHAAMHAGRISLVLCFVMFVLGTLIAWADKLVEPPSLSRGRRRQIAAVAVALAIAGTCAGALAATKGHPVAFVQRQWNGFVNASAETSSGTNFGVVGSGRYDFWRVSLDGFLAHPIGGLGQDNFADYYVVHRRIGEEPAWTHSLELRLLVHTGLVGAALFATFLIAALIAALRSRRLPDRSAVISLAQAMVGVALLPLVVWLIHGSVDWFWEMPALSGPALGFLGMAGALGRSLESEPGSASGQPGSRPSSEAPPGERRRPALPRPARTLAALAAAAAFLAATVVLAFPYLSVREVSIASNIRQSDPAKALSDLETAARLNPLSADPGRIAGAIALETGQYAEAERRFAQATSREPGGWFGWFGAGLAASALGQTAAAKRDLETAVSIQSRQPAVSQALAQVTSRHPLSPTAALHMLVLAR